MGRTTKQWRCRVVTVKYKNGVLYTTSFYACSRSSDAPVDALPKEFRIPP